MAYEDIVSRFKNGKATMMNYGYGTPGSSANTAAGMSPMNLPNARPVTTSPTSFNFPTTMYGRPPEAYNAPTTFPGVNPNANMSPRLVANAPFGFPAPSQAGNNPVGSGGFLYNPNNGFLPIPNSAPTQTAGLNIQPFGDQGNLMDPGNAGYVDPASAFAPQPAPSPAAAAINGLSPLSASERINQPMPGPSGYGLNSTDPNKLLTPSQEYFAKNAFAAGAAQGRDRSGIGTDGYVRNAAGDVIGRDGKYAGMTPSQMYDAINGNGPMPGTPGTDRNGNRIDGNPDNSTFSGSTKKYLQAGEGQYIHRDPSTGKQTIRAIPAGYEVYHPRGAGSSALRQIGQGGGGSTGGGQRPVTSGPMIAPVTGGIMTPARARPRTSGPIMRRA